MYQPINILKGLCLATLPMILGSCGPKNPPITCFEADVYEAIDLGHTFTFSDCSQDLENYLWDFGDGTTSSLKNPSHKYDDYGLYKVELTGENDEGQNIVFKYITLGMPQFSSGTIKNFQDNFGPSNDYSCLYITLYAYNNEGDSIPFASAECGSSNLQPIPSMSAFGTFDGHILDADNPIKCYIRYWKTSEKGDDTKYIGSFSLNLPSQKEYTSISLSSGAADIEMDLSFILDTEF